MKTLWVKNIKDCLMRTNIEYFNISKDNPEELLDSYYAKNKLVIPNSSDEENTLTSNNKTLLELITTFDILNGKYNKTFTDGMVQKIVHDIISILDTTDYINYSAFVQFFMVYNFTYSIYKTLSIEQKEKLIYDMLKKYCSERHRLYSNHGYTNIVLQVMCDNYSHKRNSKTGIEKFLSILSGAGKFERLENITEIVEKDKSYFLPDKGDRGLFEHFLRFFNLTMESRSIEHNKLPDVVFKCGDQYYICELKTMKEGGGGQNKQMVEVAYFIKFSEKNTNIHYITFLDGIYSNIIFHDRSPKVVVQRNAIVNALRENPGNYFFNTGGLIEFIQDISAI